MTTKQGVLGWKIKQIKKALEEELKKLLAPKKPPMQPAAG